MSEVPLLEVEDLRISATTAAGEVTLVDGVRFAVAENEVVALVGESGSGKTLTALSVLDLLPRPALRRRGGRVLFRGREVADAARLGSLRGAEVGMVFQEPRSALNPTFSLEAQFAEALRAHRVADRAELRREALLWFERVGLVPPESFLGRYPHQASGGELQRFAIAAALVHEPALLVADEPTSSLDRLAEARVLDLLDALRARRPAAMLLITHDLALARRLADRVVTLYAGRTVEDRRLRDHPSPLHPYGRLLDEAARPTSSHAAVVAGASDEVAEPSTPEPGSWPGGCRFRARCPEALPACAEVLPPLEDVAPGLRIACPPAAERVR